MTVKELEQIISNNELCLRYANNLKSSLEQLEDIKKYLKELEIIKNYQEKKIFLSQLEIGEDGTVFAKSRDIIDKSCSNFHFGLSKTLRYALGFIQRFNYEEYYNCSGNFRILYENFQKYLDNAILILNDMNYYEGDRLVENDYGLEIYENPKNYSVVDFGKLLPLDGKYFRTHFDVRGIIAGGNAFVAIDRCYLSNNELERLSTREYEAFFGAKAQQILGYSKPRVMVKKQM